MILSSIFFAIVISFIRSISIFVSSKLLLTRVMKNARVIYTRFANSRAETISWRESPTRTTTWRLAVAFVFCLWSFIFFFFFYSCTSFACSLSKRSDCFEVAANLAGRPCYGATHERDTSLRSAPRQKWQGPSNYNGWRKKKTAPRLLGSVLSPFVQYIYAWTSNSTCNITRGAFLHGALSD